MKLKTNLIRIKRLLKLKEQNKKIWQFGNILFYYRNKYDNVVYITHNDTFGDTFVNKIYPCTFESQIQNLQAFKLTPL